MAGEQTAKVEITSGVSRLDDLLGGLFIGDNVLWYDDAGSLASVFCLNFMRSSQVENKPIIYVSFDRSPRNLLEKLGPLGTYPGLTILDCFTLGKGAGSEIFLKFYHEPQDECPCRIIRVDEPRDVNQVMEALYGVHATMTGDVRLVFESITGMQELWGGETHLLSFYAHSCPRLYELNTVAYWVLEKKAHSPRLRAHLNQIAQVSIELSLKRGTTSLTILKAEGRSLYNQHQPYNYWTKALTVTFEDERGSSRRIELGVRLKELRSKRALSQTELARLVGVTPSTISQIESNLIYPSLPALLKIAEVLSVDVSSFFRSRLEVPQRLVFSSADATAVRFPDVPEDAVRAKLLVPVDFDGHAEPYLVEFAPDTKLSSHFFAHKGEEIGYVLAGKMQVAVNGAIHKLRPGDTIYLTSEIPSLWHNPGPATARLLWIKVK